MSLFFLFLLLFPAGAEAASPSPHIISRAEWGADEELLFSRKRETYEQDRVESEEDRPAISTTPSNRIADCQRWQREHPEDFVLTRTERRDENGRLYRWPLQYAPDMRMIVIHHTALTVRDDKRSPKERIQALYEYHADGKGWGDIGYHYIVDEEGNIYEGRQGGDRVVAGHAYCWNTGTVGIALLGNFELEQPTQIQIKNLQWLLDHLVKKYDIDLSSSIRFHGENLPPIVGHGDILSTACPGHYLDAVLSQVRQHVWSGNLTASVTFPRSIAKRRHLSPREQAQFSTASLTSPLVPTSPRTQQRIGLSAIGSVTMEGRPGAAFAFSVQFQNGTTTALPGTAIGSVRRSSGDIGLWQDEEGEFIRIEDEVILPERISGGEKTQLRLKLRFPEHPGTYTFSLNDITYTLDVTGRRVRGLTTQPTYQVSETSNHQTNLQNRNRIQQVRSRSALIPQIPSTPTSSYQSTQSKSSSDLYTSQTSSSPIRITLSTLQHSFTLLAPINTRINNGSPQGGTLQIAQSGNECAIRSDHRTLHAAVIRIDPGDGILTVEEGTQRYRGILECRVLDGKLVIINELPLEQYLWGLAEEPDSEPFEKQRAFAIAARTYAAHYLQPQYRKFPGQPFDGSDDPAVFQAYGGANFEARNPEWVRAVRSTAGRILTKNNTPIRAAYYSSNDGRTRSPKELGWSTFPFAEVFASKPDPWCAGQGNRGHGVGMSGCGAEGQAEEGKHAEEILKYYYPGTRLEVFSIKN